MHHYQTNYSILEHAIGVMYFCRYTLFFRITLGVGVNTMSLFIMQTCLSLRTIFYGIKVVPLTTLAAFRICPKDQRYTL